MAAKQTRIKRRITTFRWIVQWTAFAILMYGGFAARGMRSWVGADSYTQSVDSAGRASQTVKPVFKQKTSTNLVLPATACIYQRQGLCQGCSLYFVCDAISWQRPVDEFGPLLLVLVVLMLLGGRLWCGWICPLGLVSDVMTKVRIWIGLDQLRLSRRWREVLVWTKYILLLLSLGLAAFAATPFAKDDRLSWVDPFCQVCPSRIFEAFFTFDQVCWTNFRDSVTSVFSVIGLLMFVLFFLGFWIRRFWCRVCPIGALSALFNRTGLVLLAKNGQKCTRCGVCRRTCPVDVRQVYDGRGHADVLVTECQLCLRCLEACPENKCLRFLWLGTNVIDSK